MSSGDVTITNPKSLEYSVIRDKLFPGMLSLLAINKRRKLPLNMSLLKIAGLAYKFYNAKSRISQTYDDKAWVDLYIDNITEENTKIAM